MVVHNALLDYEILNEWSLCKIGFVFTRKPVIALSYNQCEILPYQFQVASVGFHNTVILSLYNFSVRNTGLFYYITIFLLIIFSLSFLSSNELVLRSYGKERQFVRPSKMIAGASIRLLIILPLFFVEILLLYQQNYL